MKTLREIGEFVNQTERVLMSQVGNDVPVLTSVERTSMRAMILALQNLPPITLEVEFVGAMGGVAPFFPLFRVLPTKGVTLFTIFAVLSQNGEPTPGLQPNKIRGNFEGELRVGIFGDPGVFRLRVTRIGTGPITLEKTFEFLVVRKKEPPPPPLPLPAAVTCSVEVDLSGFGGFVGVRIFGGGFLPPEPVHIIESGSVAATAQADQLGMYSVSISVLKGPQITDHTLHAHGQKSGRNSNDVKFSV